MAHMNNEFETAISHFYSSEEFRKLQSSVVGVLGAGHLGKIHLRLLQQSTKYELVGFYDENAENALKIEKKSFSLVIPFPLSHSVTTRTFVVCV